MDSVSSTLETLTDPFRFTCTRGAAIPDGSEAISERESYAIRDDKATLMTTMTTILALVPMAVLGGAGSEMRRPLAVSLIGGLAFGSALTLLVIPTAYYLYDSIAKWIYNVFMRILHPEELAAATSESPPAEE